MSGFIYIWYDRKHNRYYVGSHWGLEDDGYICSSRWMRKAYKRRPEDFKRRIISKVKTSRLDLLTEEQRWLDMMKDEEIKGPRYYNMMKRARPLWSTDEVKAKTVSEKLSKAIKEKRQSDPDYCERVRLATVAGREKSRQENPEKWQRANQLRREKMQKVWVENDDFRRRCTTPTKPKPLKDPDNFRNRQNDRRLAEKEIAVSHVVDFPAQWERCRRSIKEMMDYFSITRRQVEFLLSRHGLEKPKQGSHGRDNLIAFNTRNK